MWHTCRTVCLTAFSLLAWGQYTGGGPICIGPLGGGDPETKMHTKKRVVSLERVEVKSHVKIVLESRHALEAAADEWLP